jgi:hypothetical protein
MTAPPSKRDLQDAEGPRAEELQAFLVQDLRQAVKIASAIQ